MQFFDQKCDRLEIATKLPNKLIIITMTIIIIIIILIISQGILNWKTYDPKEMMTLYETLNRECLLFRILFLLISQELLDSDQNYWLAGEEQLKEHFHIFHYWILQLIQNGSRAENTICWTKCKGQRLFFSKMSRTMAHIQTCALSSEVDVQVELF